MKKTWMEPQITVEQFMANEYISSCGQTVDGKYLFTCDAGGGVYGDVYLETNGQSGLQTGRGGDTYLSNYHACGTKHEADSTNDFLDGYYVVDPGWFQDDVVTPVLVWRGPNNDNTHCTTNLDREHYQIQKS